MDIKRLKNLEIKNRPNIDYLIYQTYITEQFREDIIDWLIRVHNNENYHLETLFLSIRLLDRISSKYKIRVLKYQLIAIICYWIATKYEEDFFMSKQKIIYYTENKFSSEQIHKMEQKILQLLDFDLVHISVITFIDEYLLFFHQDEKYCIMLFYLSELILQYYNFIEYLPSIIATSILYIANNELGYEQINDKLFEVSEYTIDDLEECIEDIYYIIHHKTNSVVIKYSGDRFYNISEFIFRNKN